MSGYWLGVLTVLVGGPLFAASLWLTCRMITALVVVLVVDPLARRPRERVRAASVIFGRRRTWVMDVGRVSLTVSHGEFDNARIRAAVDALHAVEDAAGESSWAAIQRARGESR